MDIGCFYWKIIGNIKGCIIVTRMGAEETDEKRSYIIIIIFLRALKVTEYKTNSIQIFMNLFVYKIEEKIYV